MKKIVLSIALILSGLFIQAQTDGLTYQAIIIDNNDQEIPGIDIAGNYLSESEVSLRFSILREGEVLDYKEVHTVMTDPYGMVSVVIGAGEIADDSPLNFNEIEWDGLPKDLLVELSYGDDDFEELSRNALYFIPYAYHRNITATGTLMVDGGTTLNSFLNVMNQSPTYLSGDLTVDGSTQLNSTLTVEDQTLLNGDLNVLGTAVFDGDAYFQNITVFDWSDLQGDVTIGGTLDVAGATHIDNTLTVEDETTLNGAAQINNTLVVEDETTLNGATQINNTLTVENESTLNGATTVNNTLDVFDQVTIDATVNGGQSNYGAYPLRVEGSDQGVAIKVNGDRDETNNFISFWDGNDEMHGRIEGQNAGDLITDPQYIINTLILGVQVGTATADLVAASSSSTICAGLGGCVTAPIPSLVVAAGANLAAAIANLAAYEGFAYANLGVTYLSGSGDYAEYLLREIPEELITYGDIVGVRGGRISKITTGADQLMVVSYNPAVLGNMPEEGEEHLYEKVGFMGQLPVKVIGEIEIGDYILASGRNDGSGIGVAPEEMTLNDYSRIVGVAWSASNTDVGVVNVAVGINQNDLVTQLAQQQKEIDALRNELTNTNEALSQLLPEFEQLKTRMNELEEGEDLVQEEGELLTAEEMHPAISVEMIEESFEVLREELIAQGVDIDTHPTYQKLFNDQEYRQEMIQRSLDEYQKARERAIARDRKAGF